MTFIELNRTFIPVKDSNEPNLELDPIWGYFGARALEWTELHPYWRVVLLAEASCGKTAEFRNQADSHAAKGRAAFYVRIEDLADNGFETALAPATSNLFEQWRHGTDEGWFFLDSVDEARLNRKNFESSLRRFARELGESVNRAHIFISCRVSDWRGSEDVDAIQRMLPFAESPPSLLPEADADDLLLAPILKSQEAEPSHSENETASKRRELMLVQLVPLSPEQCRRLAQEAGVEDMDGFMDGIVRMGLDDFAERPGDLLDLVEYWKSYHRFASLSDMVEHSIQKKLRERDPYRLDNAALSIQKAREGAERVAAALTLGKTFTIRTPGHSSDPHRTAGALDPAAVLTDWTDAERSALLRRGIFAPATYGRVRFHHRSTQEYLTARWLERLLLANCPQGEVWHCIFAERYGVETVVPSLRPAAAWLALWRPSIRDEIIRREPIVLLQQGDPGSLPIPVRECLLAAYADKHAAAEITDTKMDRRAMWLFGDQALADAIRKAWHTNPHRDFRWKLLCFIEVASIKECADLARAVACDRSADDYDRMIAVEALKACDDQEGLAEVAHLVMQTPSAWSGRLAYRLATVLFPQHLSVQDLLTLIAESKDIARSESFHYQLVPLYEACPDAYSRIHFVTGLSDLCLSPPFVDGYQRISQRYHELATHLEPIARSEIQLLGEQEPPEYLIRLLMAVERAERSHSRSVHGQRSLPTLVQEKRRLHRALFWADVDEKTTNVPGIPRPVWHWRVYIHGQALWRLGPSDLPWLYEDISSHSDHEKKRIALQAAVSILKDAGKLADTMPHLQALVRDDSILATDLEGISKPSVEFEKYERRNRRMNMKYAQQQARREQKVKASWLRLKDELQTNPDQLRNSLEASVVPLMNLTKWLCYRTNLPYHSAPLEWRLLREGFDSAAIAEAYRDGMKAIWRITEPERSKKNSQGQTTTKWVMILSFGGIALEAAEDPNWAIRLTDQEAERAALHGFWAEQDYPEWIDDLLISHSTIALPVLKQAIIDEWSSPSHHWPHLLHAYANVSRSLQPAVEQVLFDVISGEEPVDVPKLERGLRVMQRLNLDGGQRSRLIQLGKDRLPHHRTANHNDYALQYLMLLFLFDAENAVEDLATWIDHAAPAQRRARAEQTLAVLFDRHDPLLHEALSHVSVPTLERLLYWVYGHIRPEDDNVHHGSYTPDTRDNAERARNSIFNSLLNRQGAEAFHAMQRFVERIEDEGRSRRYRELARSKAENDAEPPAWSAAEVMAFECQHTAPVKTGKDLLRLALSVLDDIQFQLGHGDASSRSLLERAQDEEEVQNWITEQINLRAHGRFHAHREAEIAQGNKPDLIVSSTSASCEVAIEIKHANKKDWTVQKLEKALQQQLAESYLKPAARRHGILLVSYHKEKRWRDPESSEWMSFSDVISRLDAVARRLTANSSGSIEARCIGIDATSAKRS